MRIPEYFFSKTYLFLRNTNFLIDFAENITYESLEQLDFSFNNITLNWFVNLNRFTNLEFLFLKALLCNLVNSNQNLISLNLNLSKLISLDLSFNCLKEIRSDDFKQLKKLNNLDLSFNQISKIDKDSFYFLDQLKILNLEGNELILFSFSISESRLESINLKSNRLQSFSKENDQEVYFDLNNVDFSNNMLEEVSFESFKLKKSLNIFTYWPLITPISIIFTHCL